MISEVDHKKYDAEIIVNHPNGYTIVKDLFQSTIDEINLKYEWYKNHYPNAEIKKVVINYEGSEDV